jgi:hypothetical protein
VLDELDRDDVLLLDKLEVLLLDDTELVELDDRLEVELLLELLDELDEDVSSTAIIENAPACGPATVGNCNAAGLVQKFKI